MIISSKYLQFYMLFWMPYLDSTLAKSVFKVLSCWGKNLSSKLKKRPKGGHERAVLGVCLACFKSKRSRFTISRYNESQVKRHIESVHKGKFVEVVGINDPKAKDAKKALEYSVERKNQYVP